MTDLNKILPSYIPNDKELTNEIAEILQDVKEQTLKIKDTVGPSAFINSIQGKKTFERKDVKHYNKDAIYKAIEYIKQSNYYCWYHIDYESQLSIWITRRNICPHPWYRSI